MERKELAKEMQELMYLIGKNKPVHCGKENHIKKHDLMFLNAISKINDGNPVKMSEISNYFNISAPATSQFIRRVEKSGYIEREVYDHDRRSVYIKISEDTKQKIKEADKVMYADILSIIDYLGDQDSKELIRIGRKLYEYQLKK